MAALAMAGWKSPATVSSPPRGAGCQQFATQKKLAPFATSNVSRVASWPSERPFLEKISKSNLVIFCFFKKWSLARSTNLRKVSLSFSRQLDLGHLRRTVPDSPDSPDSPELRVVHQVLVCSLFFFFCFFLCFLFLFVKSNTNQGKMNKEIKAKDKNLKICNSKMKFCD
jgi:hypothetical protein